MAQPQLVARSGGRRSSIWASPESMSPRGMSAADIGLVTGGCKKIEKDLKVTQRFVCRLVALGREVGAHSLKEGCGCWGLCTRSASIRQGDDVQHVSFVLRRARAEPKIRVVPITPAPPNREKKEGVQGSQGEKEWLTIEGVNKAQALGGLAGDALAYHLVGDGLPRQLESEVAQRQHPEHSAKSVPKNMSRWA